MKKFITSTILLGSLAGATSAANFENTKARIWVADTANQAVMLPRILSCILDQASVGKDDRLTNNAWLGMVNEQTCDLTDSDRYANVTIESQRASASSPQDVVGWMSLSDGDQMIMNTSIEEAPSSSNPFGKFKISFYLANPDGSYIDIADLPADSSDYTDTTYDANVDDNPTLWGYTYIYEDGNDIVIDALYAGGLAFDDTELAAKVIAIGGRLTDLQYVMSTRQRDFDNSNQINDFTFVGTTSDDEVFRYMLFSTAVGAPNDGIFDAQCNARTVTWQNVEELKLFSENGDPLSMNAPSLTFETDSNGNYGDIDSQWLFIGGGETLTKINDNIDITTIEGAQKTLHWVPGSFEREIEKTYTPNDGEKAQWWASLDGGNTWENHIVVYDEISGDFETLSGVAVPVPVGNSIYSFIHGFDINVTQSGFIARTREIAQPKTSEKLFYDANGELRTIANPAKLTCIGWNCLDQNLNLSAGDYLSVINTSNDVPDHTSGSRDEGDIFTYFVAPLKLPTGSTLVPGALYYDVTDDGLEETDKPLFHNFYTSWQFDGVRNWNGTGNTALDTKLEDLGHPWLGHRFGLVDEASCSGLSSASNAAERWEEFNKCTKIVYDYHPSNSKAFVENADGSYYAFTPPIKVKVPNYSPITDDRNGTFNTEALALNASSTGDVSYVSQGEWNAVIGGNCNATANGWAAQWDAEYKAEFASFTGGVTVNGIDLIDTTDGLCMIPVSTSYFAGDDLFLEYNGRRFTNSHWLRNEDADRYFQMINLNDGKIVEDARDPSVKYKVKATDVTEYLLDKVPSNSNAVATCTETSFQPGDATWNKLLGIARNGMPNRLFDSDHPRPTAVWQPTPSDPDDIERPDLTRSTSCFVKDNEVTCP